MKSKWICAALLTIGTAIPGAAQVSVFIGVPPPAVVYERPVPPPEPGYFWVEGYWVPAGHHYRWCRGHWERPPYEGAAWEAPRYERWGDGWRYHQGHWREREYREWKHHRHHDHDDDDDHGHGHGHHDRD